MPLSDYEPGTRGVFGYLENAMQRFLPSQDMLQEIAANARAAGITLGFRDYSSLLSAYSVFGGMRRALSEFGSALERYHQTGIDTSVTGEMIAQAPWSAPVDQFAITGALRVRVEYNLETPEGPQLRWLSLDYRNSDLTTVGSLERDAQDFVEQAPGGSPPPGAELTGRFQLLVR